MAQKKLDTWDFLHALFWGYSTLLSFIFVLLFLLPNIGFSSSGDTTPFDWVGELLLYGPLFAFFLSLVIERHSYEWNWWRILLQIYCLGITFLLVLGSFVHTSGEVASSSAIGIVSSLLFCPLLFYLVVLGNERFEH